MKIFKPTSKEIIEYGKKQEVDIVIPERETLENFDSEKYIQDVINIVQKWVLSKNDKTWFEYTKMIINNEKQQKIWCI